MIVESFRHCYGRLPEATLLLSFDGRIQEANSAAMGFLQANGNLTTLQDAVMDSPQKVARLLELCQRSRDLFPGALTIKNSGADGIPCRVEGALFSTPVEKGYILLRLFLKEVATRRFHALNERIETLNREILERKRVETQLYAQRELLRATLESIGDGVIATDISGNATFLNPVAQSLTGWRQQEATGRRLEELFVINNEHTGATVENPIHRALREGTITGLASHTVLTARDGRQVPIDDNAAPIRNAFGDITGSVFVFRDVGDRKRADRERHEAVEALRRTAEFDEAVMSNMAEGLYTVDAQGLATYVNPAAEAFFGWTSDELRGKHMHEMIHHHYPDGTVFPAKECPGLRVLTEGHELIEQEDSFIRKDGSFFDVIYSSSPLKSGNDILGLIVVFRDVSESKRKERELRAMNKALVRANEDLNQFAFAASHDLQEPLRMITSYSQLLVDSCPGEFEGDAALFLDFIMQGTARMRELLADLLAYTQVSESDGRGETAVVDLNLVFQKALENCKTAIDHSGAIVTGDPLPSVPGYEPHFLQLFQNLIGNAIKYRSGKPPRIHVSAQRVNDTWRLSISDNGIGIAPAYQRRIFGVFKRLHGRELPGTGIGLAICQRVVERYGGQIWVESQLDQGSTFFCTFPKIRQPGQREAV
jgi:PAS domain S-box-containing protein